MSHTCADSTLGPKFMPCVHTRVLPSPVFPPARTLVAASPSHDSCLCAQTAFERAVCLRVAAGHIRASSADVYPIPGCVRAGGVFPVCTHAGWCVMRTGQPFPALLALPHLILPLLHPAHGGISGFSGRNK